MAPRALPRLPRAPQEGPKRRPEGPKRRPRGPQEDPRGPQEAPSRPQEAQKRPPRCPKQVPRGPEPSPKRPPKCGRYHLTHTDDVPRVVFGRYHFRPPRDRPRDPKEHSRGTVAGLAGRASGHPRKDQILTCPRPPLPPPPPPSSPPPALFLPTVHSIRALPDALQRLRRSPPEAPKRPPSGFKTAFQRPPRGVPRDPDTHTRGL